MNGLSRSNRCGEHVPDPRTAPAVYHHTCSVKCGDEILVKGRKVTCKREKDHPFVQLNNGKTRKYNFHEGDGYVWDDRCAWPKGEEPLLCPRVDQGKPLSKTAFG